MSWKRKGSGCLDGLERPEFVHKTDSSLTRIVGKLNTEQNKQKRRLGGGCDFAGDGKSRALDAGL